MVRLLGSGTGLGCWLLSPALAIHAAFAEITPMTARVVLVAEAPVLDDTVWDLADSCQIPSEASDLCE